ncbi:MAG: hypothetical protein IPG90_00845 [Bacteroidetes bacterium]|nr:hypothetical protein [Bacteroidota bacterium]
MTFFNFILIIHIICGFTAFIVAPIAMAVKKGSAAHRKWGKIFFWAMCGVCAAALIMAPMHKNLFLTLVAVFSFYMAFSGYRVLYRKNLQNWRQVAFIDWFVVSINALFSLALIYLGIKTINSAFGVISLVFGILGLLNSLRDFISSIQPAKAKGKWFFSHMGGMIGAYIAAVSAFSAVNLNFVWLPTTIQWLWPTVIGVPLMMMWIRSYRKKFSKGRSIKQEAEVKIQAEFAE